MAWLVLLGSGLLLGSVTALDQFWLQSGLLVLFLLTGLAFYKDRFLTYLLFCLSYPLLPSQAPQLSSFDFLEFLFLCFAFWWGFSKIKDRSLRFPSTPLNRVLALLLLFVSLSGFLALLRHHYILSEVFLLKLRDSWNVFDLNADSDLMVLRSLVYLFEGVLFFFITVDLLDPQRIEKAARMIVYSALLVSVAGIFQYLLNVGLLQYWIIENPNIKRINSTFSDPNSLGTYLATLFCLNAYLFAAAKRKLRWFHAIFALIILIALLFTASRAAWAATLLTLLITPAAGKLLGIDTSAYLNGLTRWLARRGVYIAICVLFLLFAAAAIINYTGKQPESMMKILLFTFNLNLSADEILKGRVELWKTALSVFRDYPFFGCGPGSFRFLENAPYFVTSPENAHNYFLQILAETGLPGLLLFCLAIGIVFHKSTKYLRRASNSDFLLHFGLLAGVVAFLLTSLTGHPLLLLKLQFLFWGVIGLLMAHQKHPDSVNPTASVRYQWFLTGVIIAVPFFLQVSEILKTRRLSAYEYGYHPWETDEQGFPFRWTTLKAISVLDRQGEVLSFSMRQFNPEVQKKPLPVKLYLNNQLLDTIHFSDANWKRFKYFVPPLSKSHRIILRIDPGKAFASPDHQDKRELGIGIQNFTWDCGMETPIGVYEQEREGEKTYYWTRGQASYNLNRSGTSLSFRILSNVLAETEPVDVQFYWDEKEIQKRTLTTAKWEAVNLQVPDGGRISGVLTVRVSRTANLKQLSLGEDLRDLGIRMELPFQWKGMVTAPSHRIERLSNPTLYGISNEENHPLQLLLFPIDHYSSSNYTVSMSERIVPHRQGLFHLVTPEDGNWVGIYPDKPFQRFGETFVWQRVEKEIQLPSGYFLIRMKAFSMTDGGDVPVVSLRIDDREVARQPIVYGRWTNYYFPVELPNGGKKITVEYLNDYYLASPKIDRNLLIAGLAVAKAKSSHRSREGWEIVKDGLLIAEPVDRNLPFLPWNRCYTIETVK